MLRERKVICVTGLSPSASQGFMRFGPLCFRCALGRSGCRYGKREGDGATPAGEWRLRQVFYRPDRVARPQTLLPVAPLRPNMGWCDDPQSQRYNRLVRLPFPAHHERLWRNDRLYDIIVVLGYNDHPRIRGKGSAIFMHIAKPGYRPTEGCIALSEAHLRRVLAHAARFTSVRVCC